MKKILFLIVTLFITNSAVARNPVDLTNTESMDVMDCVNAIIDVSRIVPGTEVFLKDAEKLNPDFLFVTDNFVSTKGFALPLRKTKKGISFIAPLGFTEGQEKEFIYIALANMEKRCPSTPVELTKIDPIEDYPYDELFSEMKQFFNLTAQRYGTTYESLKETDPLDPRLDHLTATIRLIEDDFNLESNPMLGRLLTNSDLLNTMKEINLDLIDKLENLEPLPKGELVEKTSFGQRNLIAQRCIELKMPDLVTDAKQLSLLMSISIDSMLTDKLTAAINSLVGAIGVFDPLNDLGFTKAAGKVGILTAVATHITKLMSTNIPNEFVSKETRYDSLMYENELDDGKVESFIVSAKSPEFNDARSRLDIINNIFSTFGAIPGAIWGGANYIFPQEFDAFYNALSKVTTCTKILEKIHGPIELTPDFFEIKQDKNPDIVEITSNDSYKGLKVGKSSLKISPIPEKFGGHTIVDNLAVEVKGITLSINPKKEIVDRPGDVATMTISFDSPTNLFDDLDYQVSAGEIMSVKQQSENVILLNIKTPKNTTDFPIVVGAKYTGKRLPADKQIIEFGEIETSKARLKIKLFSKCVKPNRISYLEATPINYDGEIKSIKWTASNGVINKNDVLKAAWKPNSTGQHTISATAEGEDGETLEGLVQIRVVEKKCLGRLKIQHRFSGIHNKSTGDKTSGTFSVNIDLDALDANNINSYPIPYNYTTNATVDGEVVPCFINYPYNMTIDINEDSEMVTLFLPIGLVSCAGLPVVAEYGASTFILALGREFGYPGVTKGVSKTIESELDEIKGTTFVEWL